MSLRRLTNETIEEVRHILAPFGYEIGYYREGEDLLPLFVVPNYEDKVRMTYSNDQFTLEWVNQGFHAEDVELIKKQLETYKEVVDQLNALVQSRAYK